MTYKVKVSNVYKLYSTESKRAERLMDFFSLRRVKKNEILFAALKDVSFTAYEGETIGILGLNGSGKSTLSNILGQVVQPTLGDIKINGVPSLIAISAGLNNNLSGKDNIYLKCMMHGLTEQEIEEVKDDIIDFAEIGDYINKPVKNYSSGMRSRLGFAISVHTNPDILIIDEALSVGDTTFANKCLEKMEEFKKQGKTIFFVSHSASQMKSFCDRIIWLHYGKVRAIGTVEDVIKQYNTYVHTVKKMTQERKLELKNKSLKEQYILSKDIISPKEKRRKLPFILSIITLFIPLFIFGILVVAGY